MYDFIGVDDPLLNEIRANRGYSYSDIVNGTPEKLPDFDNKIKAFFREHIHYDEEIRYCVEGNHSTTTSLYVITIYCYNVTSSVIHPSIDRMT